MSFSVVRSRVLMLTSGRIRSVVYTVLAVSIIAGNANATCNDTQCSRPVDTIDRTVIGTFSEQCFDNGTAINISCNRGFQRYVDSYITRCNGDTGEFKPGGSCDADILTLIFAVFLMGVAILIFVLMCLVWKRNFKGWKKAMYDTSHDVSEVIDGYSEREGVVNIGMTDFHASPRIIPIEDPYETQSEAGITVSWENETRAEVHYANSSVANASAAINAEVQYANASAAINAEVQYANSPVAVSAEDTIDGYGVVNENGMLPRNPEDGKSTEKLIDSDCDEPDEQAAFFDPYASIDLPLNRARRGPSDASVGGSAVVRPVTAPPDFKDRSASVKASYDGVDAIYAKINKVKRASETRPHGSKDPSRPRGRQADIDDLLNHIDKPSNLHQKDGYSPSRLALKGGKVEDLYAEVSDELVRKSKPNPLPTAPKPARKGTNISGRREIKRYTPPSKISTKTAATSTSTTAIPGAEHKIFSVNFAPPSPPPIDGTDGLYAQIDRDRRSRKEPAASVGDSDEGFVEQNTSRV